jgi:hypothetical protein
MRRLLPLSLTLVIGACGPSAKPANNPNTASQDAGGPDGKSGPDGKRSGATAIKINTPVTDEVNYGHGDKTDWFKVDLKGRAGVLAAQVNWDNPKSDIMVDVFDAVGAQIAASPVRGAGEQLKKLLVQIDQPNTYYIRITAPGASDGSVYTLEAKWDEPAPPPPPPPPPPPDDTPPPPPKHHHEPHEVKEKPVAEGGPTLQGRIVSAYREGEGLTLQIDKGSAQGVKTGQSGSVLSGPSGEDPLDGAAFTVKAVLGPNKCLAKTNAHSIGKNNRVTITLGR